MQTGIFSTSSEIYSKTLRVFASKLIPFMRQHYFGKMNDNSISGGYNINKKAVIVSFLARMKIYDEYLFKNFAKHLGMIVAQASHVVSSPTGPSAA